MSSPLYQQEADDSISRNSYQWGIQVLNLYNNLTLIYCDFPSNLP